jgi:DNA topoisomerase-1
MMEEHFQELVDYQFTADMEDLLDSISREEAEAGEYLHDFYFGSAPGLKSKLEDKIKEVDARAICTFPIPPAAGQSGQPSIDVRVGRYGPYLEQGDRKASLPENLPPDELTFELASKLLDQSQTSEEPLGIDPQSGKPVYIKSGRFGPYVQLGSTDDDEKPKNASLLKGMSVDEVTLEVALQLLSLPRTVGVHPDSNEPIVAQNGRFGPYLKCGAETRSLPADISPIDVTLSQALHLLAQPKTRGRGRAAPREPLKTFELPSPVTGKPIQLLDGRYGPYLTDGDTNASLPKDLAPEAVTFERALELLAERAAKSPSRGARGRRKNAATRKKSPKTSTGKAARKKKPKA